VVSLSNHAKEIQVSKKKRFVFATLYVIAWFDGAHHERIEKDSVEEKIYHAVSANNGSSVEKNRGLNFLFKLISILLKKATRFG